MKYLKFTVIFIFAVFVSCGEMIQEISWETKNIPQKLIVEGNITTEYTTHPISLKYSDDFFADNPARGVSGATIRITSEDTVINYIEHTGNAGIYEAEFPFSGRISTSYNLDIQLSDEIDGTRLYSATTEIVRGMWVDYISAELYKNPVYFDDKDSLIVVVFINGLEPEEIDNYYLLNIFRNGQLLTDTINQYRYFSDLERGINGAEIFGLLFQDEFVPGDTLGLKLYSIPERYDYFLDGINLISQPGDPFGFSGPPANAIGNINDGNGLGFFYGAHVTYSETIIVDKTDE